jgi:hypothetical protein
MELGPIISLTNQSYVANRQSPDGHGSNVRHPIVLSEARAQVCTHVMDMVTRYLEATIYYEIAWPINENLRIMYTGYRHLIRAPREGDGV